MASPSLHPSQLLATMIDKSFLDPAAAAKKLGIGQVAHVPILQRHSATVLPSDADIDALVDEYVREHAKEPEALVIGGGTRSALRRKWVLDPARPKYGFSIMQWQGIPICVMKGIPNNMVLASPVDEPLLPLLDKKTLASGTVIGRDFFRLPIALKRSYTAGYFAGGIIPSPRTSFASIIGIAGGTSEFWKSAVAEMELKPHEELRRLLIGWVAAGTMPGHDEPIQARHKAWRDVWLRR